MDELLPINELERAIISAKRGDLPLNVFIEILLRSQLNVPSAKEIQEDGYGIEPLFFEKENVGMLVAFTERSRMSQYAVKAPYCLMLEAFDLIRMIPKQYGLVINPGLPLGFEIPPSGIAEILKDLGHT